MWYKCNCILDNICDPNPPGGLFVQHMLVLNKKPQITVNYVLEVCFVEWKPGGLMVKPFTKCFINE